MPLGDRSVGQCLPNFLSQLKQPQRIRHRDTAFADPLRQPFLGEPVLVEQLLVGMRLFERIQVAALDVFDQCHFQAGLGRRLLDHGRHRWHARQLDRSPAALAGDQLERAIRLLTDQHGL